VETAKTIVTVLYIFLQYIALYNGSSFQLNDLSSIPTYMENFRVIRKNSVKRANIQADVWNGTSWQDCDLRW